MKAINLCTLQVRVGKCNLNLKSKGFFSVSLQMGNHTSSISPIKTINNCSINFNSTLRMNVQKQLLEKVDNAECRILLLLIRENRQKQVIGVATVNILHQNNQGFRFHQFGQCEDCEAKAELSVTYSDTFQLAVRSQINYYCGNSPNQGNKLGYSRGKSIADDSILDRQDFNVLKYSKTVNRPGQSKNLRTKRKSNLKNLRKPKPFDLNKCTPEQIITHYETQINTLQQQLRQQDDWATGMKELVQQLQAQNQLLKQIKIQQLGQFEIKNLQEGIDYVSKLVHSKFQASRSVICESPGQPRVNQILSPRQEKTAHDDDAVGQQAQTQHPSRHNQQFSGQPLPTVLGIESMQTLQTPLTTSTGQSKPLYNLLQKTKISELQQQLIQLRQQRQKLHDVTEQLYAQSKEAEQEKDLLLEQYKQLQIQLERVQGYLQQVRLENSRLKYENQRFEKPDDLADLHAEIHQLRDRVKDMERQVEDSAKACQEFKDDALCARNNVILKERQISSYKQKFGEIGSLTVFDHGGLLTSGYKKNRSVKEKIPDSRRFDSSPQDLHLIYTNLLQTSINQRKQLQHSLSQIIDSKTSLSSTLLFTEAKQQKVKRLQTQINKMFVQLLKNRSQIKNIAEVERAKGQITKQVDEILAGI